MNALEPQVIYIIWQQKIICLWTAIPYFLLKIWFLQFANELMALNWPGFLSISWMTQESPMVFDASGRWKLELPKPCYPCSDLTRGNLSVWSGLYFVLPNIAHFWAATPIATWLSYLGKQATWTNPTCDACGVFFAAGWTSNLLHHRCPPKIMHN